MFSIQWLMVMRTRLTSLVLLLMLAGSAFAGIPLHSNEQSCPMGGAMGDMEEGAKGFGAHSDQERILEEALYKHVQFIWSAVTGIAASTR